MQDNALTDPAYTMPPVPTGGPTPGIRWLRRNIARFADGPDHARRRRLVTDMLAGVDVVELRGWAAEFTRAILNQAGPVDLMTEVARVVPVEVLGAVLGLPSVPARSVAVIARAYQPGTGAEEPADEAVAELVEAFGGVADEAAAGTIALLVQACDATAGLVGNAVLRAVVDGVVVEAGPDRSVGLVAGAADVAGVVGDAGSGAVTNCLVDGVVVGAGRDPSVPLAAGAADAVGDAGSEAVTSRSVDEVGAEARPERSVGLVAGPADAADLAGDAASEAVTNRLVDGVVARPDPSVPLAAGTADAAGLAGNAASTSETNRLVEAVVAETLREDPPVRMTRRQVAGTVVAVDLAGLPFGAGPHECPGRDHAQAIAAGILESVRGCRLVDPHVEYEPSVALRIPAALVVMPGGG